MPSKEELRAAVRGLLSEDERGEVTDGDDTTASEEIERYRSIGPAGAVEKDMKLLARMSRDPSLRPLLDSYLEENPDAIEHVQGFLTKRDGGEAPKGKGDISAVTDAVLAQVERKMGQQSHQESGRLWRLEARDSIRELKEDPILGSVFDEGRDMDDIVDVMRRRNVSAKEAFMLHAPRRIQEEVAKTARGEGPGSEAGGELTGGGRRRRRKADDGLQKEYSKAREDWHKSIQEDEGVLHRLIVAHAGGAQQVYDDITSRE